MGLKAVLYTMVLAGTYKQSRNSQQLWFCPLEPVMEHLSMCEGYAVKHGDRPDAELMAAIRNIDEG
eukprot:4722322-Karenia_brevis.AAC.1